MTDTPQFAFAINDQALRLQLARLGGAVNPVPLLKIAAAHMIASVARTFRDEGSPAGSWAPLALSTIKRYGRKAAGHKLLIMSARLKNSVTSASADTIEGRTLTIGTNLVYARVQQMGSGGASTAGARMQVAQFSRRQKSRDTYSMSWKRGRTRRKLVEKGYAQVRAHSMTINQNIPARPYLVFRPEDPEMIARKMEAYVAQNIVEGETA